MVFDLTAFQEKLLFAIAGDTSQNEEGNGPKGLKAKEDLERRFYDEEVNHGRLYPNLDDLVEWGLIEKGERDKRTNYYQLTADGHEYLENLLLEYGDCWSAVAADADGTKVVVERQQIADDRRHVIPGEN